MLALLFGKFTVIYFLFLFDGKLVLTLFFGNLLLTIDLSARPQPIPRLVQSSIPTY